MNKILDIIIIGSGPAGLTAAIYASRREMKTLVIGKELGGQISLASEIENFPSFKSIESIDLISRMQEQVNHLNVDIIADEVKSISKNSDKIFTITTNKNQYSARTVVIAMGLIPRRLAIPGETEFSGKGVSYCANCDGPLFRDKTIAVVGGGNSALDSAEIMSKIAEKVYLIHRQDQFRGFEALIEDIKLRDNIDLITSTIIKKIIGNKTLSSLLIENIKTKVKKELKVDGLFIEIGRIAHTDLVKNLVERDEFKQIIVDVKCKTKTPGIFAAGDVTTVPYKQITTAVGQGTIAALAAYEYLQQQSGRKTISVYDRSKPKKL